MLDRLAGDVVLVVGPEMFLPNPIKQVIVRRILTDSECNLYYPGNLEVLRFNRELAQNGIEVSSDPATMNAAIARTVHSSNVDASCFNDAMARSTTYTPPRMITLNTKFDGAVQVNVWSGFAVQVVNSKGDRRTIVGPRTVLLDYDEKLERLSLSKGKPKNNDTRIETPYLRYISNPVSDIILLKTQDLVNVDVQVKYLVRFETDEKENWFSIDNYVQYMVDHLRSLIGNAVRSISVQEFYTNATNILRDVVLGKKEEEGERPLKHFSENGMTVYDLELIAVTVQDKNVADLLARSRQETLTEAIALERSVSRTHFVAGTEKAKRDQMMEASRTAIQEIEIDLLESNRQATLDLAQAEHVNKQKQKEILAEKERAEIKSNIEALLLEINKSKMDLEQTYKDADIARQIQIETEFAKAHETRMRAVTPTLVEAIVGAAQSGQFQAMAEYLAPLALVRGESLAGTMEQIFKGTALETMVSNLQGMSKVGRLSHSVEE